MRAHRPDPSKGPPPGMGAVSALELLSILRIVAHEYPLWHVRAFLFVMFGCRAGTSEPSIVHVGAFICFLHPENGFLLLPSSACACVFVCAEFAAVCLL
jgi:hypothetical protein